MKTLLHFSCQKATLLKRWAALTLGILFLSSTFVATQASDPAPSVPQLQKAIGEAGGWEKKDGGPIIIVIGGGGNCECTVRDPKTGRCLAYICGAAAQKNPNPITNCKCVLKDPYTGKCLKFVCPSDSQQKTWGPIRVPRPVANQS